MKDIDPAFPVTTEDWLYTGISRRGFYAAHALAGYIAREIHTTDKCVIYALMAADKLMAALEKKPEAPAPDKPVTPC